MRNVLLSLPLIIILTGCAAISRFDQNSLEAAIRLKAESLELVSHGTQPAIVFGDKIAALQSGLAAQLSYEKGKKHNEVSAKQWELISSQDHLLGRFLKDWMGGKIYSKTFIQEEQTLIADSFDQVIFLEGAKNHE